MFCKNCGKEIPTGSSFCQNCGASSENKPAVSKNEGNTFGWGFLGFLIPVVGLILFLVWKDERPKAARSAGKGALISVILSAVFYAIYFIALGTIPLY